MTGAGKTTIALQFALEGVRRGEQALYVNFQENPAQLRRADERTWAPIPTTFRRSGSDCSMRLRWSCRSTASSSRSSRRSSRAGFDAS